MAEQVTFLVGLDDIFNLLATPGGKDLNQHIVISPSALGTKHNMWMNSIWKQIDLCGGLFSKQSYRLLFYPISLPLKINVSD